MAMRSRGGDKAVFEALSRAGELYISRIQEHSAVDQLASLFAECGFAEAQPSKSEPSLSGERGLSFATDAQRNSILAETGRTQIVLDAFADGSSSICLQCGGLVSNHDNNVDSIQLWC